VVGLVTEAPGQRFSITELGATLRSDVPGSMRAWVEFCGDPYYLETWVHILHSVRTGGPTFDHVHGTTLFAYLAEHPQESRVFDEAMTSLTSNDAPHILAAYDFTPFQRVIDIGGGQGTLLLEILKTNERAEGVLFDLPHVTGGVTERIADLGLAGRCEVASGDFFTEVPTGGDAYLLKFIVHDWDDAASQQILRSCRRAIAPGGKLLAIETIVPPPGIPGHSKLDDIEMMILLGSQERTEDEYRALLRRSGFRLARVVPATSLLNVIEADPL
jgi:SAM-dependent methyltransferase